MAEIAFLRKLEDDLREIAERDARTPVRHVYRRRSLAGLIGTGLVAAVAVAVIGNPFSAGASKLGAAAQAAVAPPDVIEHTIQWTKQIENGATVTVRAEQWNSSSDPSTWRSVTDDPANVGIVESAERPGFVSSYDAANGVIYDRAEPANWKGSDLSMAEQDLNAVRIALAHSSVKDMGATTIDGQAVERFDYGSRESNGQACSYYATSSDLRPVSLDCTNLLGHPWLTSHETYEWLAPTPANAALMSLSAQDPDARIDAAPMTSCDHELAYFGPADPRSAPCWVNAPNG